jgi:hypothetical protein
MTESQRDAKIKEVEALALRLNTALSGAVGRIDRAARYFRIVDERLKRLEEIQCLDELGSTRDAARATTTRG